MFLVSFFLTFRLHSLKELRIKEQRNNFFLRNLTKQNDQNKFPILPNSKKIKEVTTQSPMCGPFTGPQNWNETFTNYLGKNERFHFCDYEQTPIHNIQFENCNEYSQVALADCTSNPQYHSLILQPNKLDYSFPFLGIVRTIAGFPNGLFYLTNTESIIHNSFFHYCGAFNDGSNITAGQLITVVGGSHDWKNLEFKYCGQYTVENTKTEFGDPSTIAISGDATCQFNNISFLNQNDNIRPELLTKIRAVSISDNATVEWTNGKIEGVSTFSTSTRGGGAFYLNSESTITLTSITFANCTDKSTNKRNAIYATKNVKDLTIKDCTFLDCFNHEGGSDQNAIYIEGNNTHLLRNTINFTNPENSCRCVYIKNTGTFEINDNTFSNAHITNNIDNRNGAGLYHENLNTDHPDPNFVAKNNTFVNLTGHEGTALYIKSMLHSIVDMITGTIKNCLNGNFIYYQFDEDKDENDGYKIYGFTFDDNTFNSHQTPVFKIEPRSNVYQITISDCIFKNNQGIALYLDADSGIQSYQLSSCLFESNNNTNIEQAIFEMALVSQITFSDCIFSENMAEYGAIAVNCDGYCTFDATCKFVRNHGKDCHCIFTRKARELIVSAHFSNNSHPDGAKPCIHSTVSTTIDCEIDNSGFSEPTGGIFIDRDVNFTARYCTFTSCNSGDGHGPIRYEIDAPHQNRVIIEDCHFVNGRGSSGVALYLKGVSPNLLDLNLLSFKHNEFNNNLIYIKFHSTNDFYEMGPDFEFEGNRQQNSQEDSSCGGSGLIVKGIRNLEISDCLFNMNHAARGGGFGLFNINDFPNVHLLDCEFTSNTANYGAGCSFSLSDSQTVVVESCHFTNNHANNEAGSFHIRSNGVSIRDCTISNDSAAENYASIKVEDILSYHIDYCSFKNFSCNNDIFRFYTPKIGKNISFDFNNFENIASASRHGALGLNLRLRDHFIINGGKITKCHSTNNSTVSQAQIVIDSFGNQYYTESPGNDNPQFITYLQLDSVEFDGQYIETSSPGARAIIVPNGGNRYKKLRLESCIFKNFNLPKVEGSALWLDLNDCCYINNCSFDTFICGNVFSFPRMARCFQDDQLIENCNFTNIAVTPTSDNENEDISLNGIIYFKEMQVFVIRGCQFISCRSQNTTKPRPALKFLTNMNTAHIQNCYFEHNGPNVLGSCILYETSGNLFIEITNCTFINNGDTTNSDVTDIAINGGNPNSTIIINNCTINPNHHIPNNNKKPVAIQLNADRITFEYSTIEDTDSFNDEDGICGLSISGTTTTSIQYNVFRNTHSVAFLYQDPNTQDTITCKHNIWDNCRQKEAVNDFNKCAFDIRAKNLLSFENNTIQNCFYTKGYIGFLNAKNSLLIDKCTFHNNNSGEKGGGIGLELRQDNQLDVTFEQCHFTNNHANNDYDKNGCGGSIQFGSLQDYQHQYHIYNCEFTSNVADRVGGAICIDSQKLIEIINCTFMNNRATQLHTNPENQGGAAIFIRPKPQQTAQCLETAYHQIINCTFEGNSAQTDSHAIHFEGKCLGFISQCIFNDNSKANAGAQISTKAGGELEITNCEIERDLDSTRCRAIHLISGKLNLHDCKFKNLAMIQGGSAILIDGSGTGTSEINILIHNNTFTNCGTQGYVVKCNGPSLSFNNNTIIFDIISQSCGCLDIASGNVQANHEVTNNHFHHMKTLAGGGAFHYDNGGASNSQILVDNNTFEFLEGDTQVCFYIETNSPNFVFSNNFIQNNHLENANSYVCAFNFKGTNNLEVNLVNNSFINNSCYSDYGGGSGIWFQNKENRDADDSIVYSLTFLNCTFDSNYAHYREAGSIKSGYNGKGGAFQLGWTETTSQTELNFTDCKFLNNRSERQGGALSISVIQPVTITRCNFSHNQAGSSNWREAGAIFIDPDFEWPHGHFDDIYCPSVDIRECEFTENKATDVSAIYIKRGEFTTVTVDSCNFYNNNNGNNDERECIQSECQLFIIKNSKFIYNPQSAKTTRPIKAEKGGLLVKNCEFENVNMNTYANQGTTIHSTIQATVEIDNVTLTNCGTSPTFDRRTTIWCYSTTFYLANSIIKFDDYNNAVAAVHVEAPSVDLHIINNTFCNCSSNAPNPNDNSRIQRGIVYYWCSQKTNQDEYIVICNNTIDHSKFSNNREGFGLSISPTTDNINFSNNIFQNFGSQDAGSDYICLFIFQNAISQLLFDNCKFKNIVSNSLYGGGTGLWIAGQGQNYDLKFAKCSFVNLTVQSGTDQRQGYGGGLQFGITETNYYPNIYITDSVFLGNAAPKGGGGLSLAVEGSISIENTIFEENTATTDGGAIMIYDQNRPSRNAQLLSIKNCSFLNNQASNGNAIFIPRCKNALIEGCNFTDNRRNGNQLSPDISMLSSVASLHIQSSLFQHTTDDIMGRAIDVVSPQFTITSSNITNYNIDEDNAINAISIDSNVELSIIEKSIFEDNGNSQCNGFVIKSRSKELTFTSNTIHFTSMEKSASALYVPDTSKLIVTKSIFTKCYFHSEIFNSSSAINYEGKDRSGVDEEIVIQGNTFSNNGGYYCSCLIINSTELPLIKNLTFANNNQETETSAQWNIVVLFKKRPDEFTFENINFDNNYFRHPTEKNGGGIGLWAAEFNPSQTTRRSYELKFKDCTFRENHAVNCGGGGFSYGYGSDTIKYIILSFDNCKFIGNQCPSTEETGGGALNIDSPETATITNCIFENNKATGETYKHGHAIYAGPNSQILVTGCTFTNNGLDDGKDSVIQLVGQDFTFDNSRIQYTDDTIASRGIWMSTPGEVNLINSHFIKCNSKSEGGALYYNCSEATEIEEIITIEGCTFDSCLGSNGLAMLLKITNPPTLYNNKFINHQSGHYVISIFFTSFVDIFSFDRNEFTNNYCKFMTAIDEYGNSIEGNLDKPDGGGSGIWIANQEEIANGRPCELIFRNCIWSNNKSPSRGGAFHYGSSNTVIGTELTFEECEFTNNTAVGYGGAVSLATYSPTVFTRCKFAFNQVTDKSIDSTLIAQGCAICIDSDTPLCQISRCTFTNQSTREGNAIYASRKVNALHIIDNSVFENCGYGDGSVIVTKALEFHFRNSRIEFGARLTDRKCRGITIAAISTTFISEAIFKYCNAPGSATQSKGGGLLLDRIQNNEGDQEEFEIENAEFTGCTGISGTAAYLCVNVNPTIRGLKICEHEANTSVQSFFQIESTIFQSNFILTDCTFYKNKFLNQQAQDGGGSGFKYTFAASTGVETVATITFQHCNWTRNIGYKGGAYSHSNSSLNIAFEDCTFEHNQVQKEGGTAGALYIHHTGEILIDNCTFYRNMCYGSNTDSFGGGIVFDSLCSSAIIRDTTFQRNQANTGHAIYTTTSMSTLRLESGCRFLDNSNGEIGYQICHCGAGIEATGTTIEYSLVRLHAGGIKIKSKSISKFTQCTFTYCEIPSEKGGGISLYETTGSATEESIDLDRCIFDKCNSSEGGAAFYIDATSLNATIKGCTFKNHFYGHSILYLKYPNDQPANFEGCIFENNFYRNTATNIGFGGCGIQLSFDYNSILFTNCQFLRNTADYVGGGFAYNSDKPITFDGCIFTGNKCNGAQAGALYLETNANIIIRNTQFEDNQCKQQATSKGMNVYIKGGTANTVVISNCAFGNLKSIDLEGSALYAENCASLAITSTSFTNCGTGSGSVIYSTCSAFSMTGTGTSSLRSRISFSTTNNPQGISLPNPMKEVNISNTLFANCYAFSSISEKALLSNCQFDNCKAHISGFGVFQLTGLATFSSFRISFSNHKDITSHLCTIQFAQKASTYELASWYFTSNSFDTDSPLININTDALTFISCYFESNTNKQKGGAYVCSSDIAYTFSGCFFSANTAHEQGGALYVNTNQPFVLSGKCNFVYNVAKNGGGIYIASASQPILFSDISFGYNTLLDDESSNSAIYISGTNTLNFTKVIVGGNNGTKGTITINYITKAYIEDSHFNFIVSNKEPQMKLSGNYIFDTNCFIHTLDSSNFEDEPVYLQHTGSGTVALDYTNCVNSSESAIDVTNKVTGQFDVEFNCSRCNETSIDEVPPATPKQTLAATRSPTQSPMATETPKPSQSLAPYPTEKPTQSPSNDEPDNPSGNSSSKSKSNSLGMIIGIVVAGVVLIAVVIIIIYIFVFRIKGNQDDQDPDTTAGISHEPVASISRTENGTSQEDPIWAGATATQDNPLFNGADGQDDDHMMQAGFEESWGENII